MVSVFGLPASTFLGIYSWPVIWTVVAILAYRKMRAESVFEAEEGEEDE